MTGLRTQPNREKGERLRTWCIVRLYSTCPAVMFAAKTLLRFSVRFVLLPYLFGKEVRRRTSVNIFLFHAPEGPPQRREEQRGSHPGWVVWCRVSVARLAGLTLTDFTPAPTLLLLVNIINGRSSIPA